MDTRTFLGHKSYVVTYFVLCAIAGVVIAASYLFLGRTGEILHVSDIARAQQHTGGLYGTATNQDTYQYKLALYRAIKPEVVTMGSSRVMQFRKSFFSVPFVNLGGSINFMNEGLDAIHDVLSIHKPKLIILGLDFWWFNGNRQQPLQYPMHRDVGNEITVNKILFPLEALKERKLSPNVFFERIFHGGSLPDSPIGVNAIVNREGFGADGSYYYLSTIWGGRKSGDYRFANTISRIDRGDDRFEYGIHFSEERFSQYLKFLEVARQHGVTVLSFLPPLAPSIQGNMRKIQTKYQYIDQLRQRLAETPVQFFDFHDADRLGSTDCEFVDGFHGGDGVYSRILLNMARQNPLLQQYTRVEYLKAAADIKGMAMLPTEDMRMSRYQEVDFLGFGCAKGVQEKTP